MHKYTDDNHSYAHQAFRLLQVAFILIPIIAGLDKFAYFLTNWSKYISPQTWEMIRGNDRTFMILAGIIEIIVGIGVLLKPKIFAYIVGVWLMLIVINLLIHGRYLDVALRDFGLGLAAFALARLSHRYDWRSVKHYEKPYDKTYENKNYESRKP